jgi:hypothetical protein
MSQLGRGLTVETVLDPIPTKDLTPADVDQLTRDTREKMLNVISDMSQDPESRSIRNQKKES